MKPILVGAAAFGCVTGPSGAGENGNPSLAVPLAALLAVLLAALLAVLLAALLA